MRQILALRGELRGHWPDLLSGDRGGGARLCHEVLSLRGGLPLVLGLLGTAEHLRPSFYARWETDLEPYPHYIADFSWKCQLEHRWRTVGPARKAASRRRRPDVSNGSALAFHGFPGRRGLSWRCSTCDAGDVRCREREDVHRTGRGRRSSGRRSPFRRSAPRQCGRGRADAPGPGHVKAASCGALTSCSASPTSPRTRRCRGWSAQPCPSSAARASPAC